jgi:hypothetical protein
MRTIPTLLAATAIAVAPMVVTAPAHAWPWQGCEETVTNALDADTCFQDLHKEMLACDTTDPTSTKQQTPEEYFKTVQCENAVDKKLQELTKREELWHGG